MLLVLLITPPSELPFGCRPFGFVHVPKAGGTSIASLWRGAANYSRLFATLRFQYAHLTSLSHDTALSMRRHVGAAKWTSAFTFAIVRDPYDFMVSQFFYHVSEHCSTASQQAEPACLATKAAGARGLRNHSDTRYVAAFGNFLQRVESARFSNIGLLSKMAIRDGKRPSQRAWLTDENDTAVLV